MKKVKQGRPVQIKNKKQRMKHKKEQVNQAVSRYYKDKKRVHPTFSQDEYALIDMAAKKMNVTVTGFVYGAALKHAREITKKS